METRLHFWEKHKYFLSNMINITTQHLSCVCFHIHTYIQETVSHSTCGELIWAAASTQQEFVIAFLRVFINFKVKKKIQKKDHMTRDVLAPSISLKAPLPWVCVDIWRTQTHIHTYTHTDTETDSLQHEIPDASRRFPSGSDTLHHGARWYGAVQGQMVRSHAICSESGSWAQEEWK